MPRVSKILSARIVVVGAGAAGLASAWQLAKAGHDVTLVDRGEVGRGALWASGGMLAAGFEASVELDPHHGLARPFSTLLQYGLSRWPEWAAELEATQYKPLGFKKSGAVTPLYGEGDVAKAAGVLDRAKALGLTAEQISSAQLHELEPGLARADGAILFPGDGQLDNRALSSALSGAVFSSGGRIEMRQRVKGLHRGAGGVTGVVLNAGRVIEADFVVLTTGAAQIEGVPTELHVRPVKGQMLAFEKVGTHTPRHVIRGFSIYLCAKPGGRLIAGATVEPGIEELSTTEDGMSGLLQAARGVMPGLRDHQPCERWSGLRPASRDLMPVIGEVEPGLILAGGGYRNGVLLAPVMAETVAAIVEGKNVDDVAAAFTPHRESLRTRRDH